MPDQIGFVVKKEQPYQDVVVLVIEALKAEGFGVLTEIDVKATLKKKIDVDFRPYVILGACNPPLAYQALSSQPEVGMMLPCNVTVEADGNGGSIIRILDPKTMMMVGALGDDPTLRDVAAQAHEKLKRVAKSLSAR
jgi:uncharacterized protein (DUF302 family)